MVCPGKVIHPARGEAMEGKTILANFSREHAAMRARFEDALVVLDIAAAGRYQECQQAVSTLRGLCRFLEHELPHHLREEEVVLYATVKQRLPRLAPLVSELQDEHETLRQLYEEFRREFQNFNSSGELGRLPLLGRDLVERYLKHMAREESQLFPRVLAQFSEADWWVLRRLYVDSEVA